MVWEWSNSEHVTTTRRADDHVGVAMVKVRISINRNTWTITCVRPRLTKNCWVQVSSREEKQGSVGRELDTKSNTYYLCV